MLRLTQRDVSAIGLEPTQWYDVTVTETLEQIVRPVDSQPSEGTERRGDRRRGSGKKEVLKSFGFCGIMSRIGQKASRRSIHIPATSCSFVILG